MPGSPATSPRFGAPRFAQSDLAVFSTDINPIVDAFDNAAKLSELTAETTRAEAAETAEAAARAAADTAEAAARAAADTAEAAARVDGDNFAVIHVATMDSQTSPPQAAGTVVGHVPVSILGTGVWTLRGVISRAMVAPSGAASVYKVQTDTGHSDGTLADVSGLSGGAPVTPATGRAVRQAVTSGGTPTPLPLNDLDTVAVVLVTPGTTKGPSVALEFVRAHS